MACSIFIIAEISLPNTVESCSFYHDACISSLASLMLVSELAHLPKCRVQTGFIDYCASLLNTPPPYISPAVCLSGPSYKTSSNASVNPQQFPVFECLGALLWVVPHSLWCALSTEHTVGIGHPEQIVYDKMAVRRRPKLRA